MANVYVYAITHDLGFSPNPFGGVCSLACCKPNIRQRAKLGDWIIGLTGTKLKPALRCVFAMVVTEDISFDEYWMRPEFSTRQPKRNGTRKKQVGDNIYHRHAVGLPWIQEDSAHSLNDGSQCHLNTAHDTRVNRVLISNNFIYFGSSAPAIPDTVLKAMNLHRNARDYRRYDLRDATSIVNWLQPKMIAQPNAVISDPINFLSTEMRYSASQQRLV